MKFLNGITKAIGFLRKGVKILKVVNVVIDTINFLTERLETEFPDLKEKENGNKK